MANKLFLLIFTFLHLYETHFIKRTSYVGVSRLTYPKIIDEPLNVPCSTPMCKGPLSEIYCHGPLLSAAWQFGLEKTCPGDRLKLPAHDVLANFKKLTYPLKREVFQKFCQKNFEAIDYLETANLPDWTPNPSFLENITNTEMKSLANAIHEKWKLLARKFRDDVFEHTDRYPLYPVQNPFIVPGGRFEVYFYWDTYWILKGLLISGMTETTEGIIDNFAQIIQTNGFIPNSGDIQLSRRTQPPLFSLMVWEFTKKTGTYKKNWLEAMNLEMKYWEENRSVKFKKSVMFQYKTETDCPRPENFLADYQAGINQTDPSAVWKSIASACESGWDFSSRWMNESLKTMSTIHTDKIIPVDLNVFMAINYNILVNYYNHFEEYDNSESYRQKFEDLTQAIQQNLWDEQNGCWFDYDLLIDNKNLNFYPSNVFPLMIPDKFLKYGDRVAEYLKRVGALNFEGGVPTTLPVNSTQQWDFPNVWAPNQHFVVQSFLATNNSFLLSQAETQAKNFINNVNNGLFHAETGRKGAIYEKYDARSSSGSPGGGGEYEVQEGFGWTNGAVLDLIWQFRNSKDEPKPEKSLFGSFFAKIFIISSWGLCGLMLTVYISRALYQKRARSRTALEERSLLEEENSHSD